MSKTEVATTEAPKTVIAFLSDDQVPDYVLNGTGAGNENVGSGDLAIPRLDLIQQLSPQLDRNDAKYIEGAQLGHIFNTLTGEIYTHCFVINLHYEVKWQVFKDRKFGGGFEGSFNSEAEALAYLDSHQLPRQQYNITETGIHKCLLLNDQGQPDQPVLIYMAGSKFKVSREWNSAIRLKNPNADRFASVWTLSAVGEKNKNGQPYQNFKVDFAGWAPKDLYEAARRTYEGFVMGASGTAAATETVH